MVSRKSWPPTPMSPVEQTRMSSAAVAVPASVRSCGGGLGGQGGRLVSEVTGVAVGSPGVEDNGAGLTVGGDLLGPQDGVGLAAVRGVDGGDGSVGAGVDDEREVFGPAGFESGGQAGGGEAEWCGHAHGATPSRGSAVVSSRPRARWMDCRAWPAVPRTRLSRATTTRIVSARSSTVNWMCARFDPVVDEVRGHWPSGRTRTKGSSA